MIGMQLAKDESDPSCIYMVGGYDGLCLTKNIYKFKFEEGEFEKIAETMKGIGDNSVSCCNERKLYVSENCDDKRFN